ncbi:MAG: hypothetical protein WCL23_04100 [Candidatus Moraniibacteriota bacterium]
MNPDFEARREKYILMEAKLEEPRKVSSEAHFLLNDVAQKIASGQELTSSDTNLLETLWSELQGEDREICEVFEKARSHGMITSTEALVSTCLFLISAQIGPDCSRLRDAVRFGSTIEIFTELSGGINIPEQTRAILVSTFRKMRGGKGKESQGTDNSEQVTEEKNNG